MGEWMYIVQSIISWIAHIVVLLCTTADTWSHEMVPCPFLSRPSKKQLRVCSIFRKKVTFLEGSCLRAAKIENVAVWAMGKHQVLPKIRQLTYFIQSLMQPYNYEFFLYCFTHVSATMGHHQASCLPKLSHCNLYIKCFSHVCKCVIY
jgi:hypothetical protein